MKYHVCEEKWDGEDLISLAEQYNEEEAIEVFLERWPEASEALAMEHINKVWLYESLDEARRHQRELGGEILVIDDESLEVKRDIVEGFWYVNGYIPKKNIKRLEGE